MPVAEQEVSASEDISHFYDYYLPVATIGQNETATDWLRITKHQFIYGNPGSGKTTTRLNFELECRTVPDGTLATSIVFGQNVVDPLTLEEHINQMSQAIAVDLLIQVIEQLTPGSLPFKESQIALLRAQVRQGGTALRRMLRSMAETVFENNYRDAPGLPGSRAGLGYYWTRVGRYPVRYVTSSEPLKVLLHALLETDTAKPAHPHPAQSGFDALWQSVAAAQAWGFQRIFALVDGVDMRARKPKDMHRLVAQLIEHLKTFQDKNIYLKMFLPLEVKPLIAKQIEQIPGLNSMVMDATIQWDQQTLRQLLIQRFRAAGSQTINSLDVLASDDLEQGLEHAVIELAQGSPRRMLTIMSELINAHVSQRGKQIKFDRHDWDLMKELVRWQLADSNL